MTCYERNKSGETLGLVRDQERVLTGSTGTYQVVLGLVRDQIVPQKRALPETGLVK